jgi:hypothetical protein
MNGEYTAVQHELFITVISICWHSTKTTFYLFSKKNYCNERVNGVCFYRYVVKSVDNDDSDCEYNLSAMQTS